jgi:hypothetical protein
MYSYKQNNMSNRYLPLHRYLLLTGLFFTFTPCRGQMDVSVQTAADSLYRSISLEMSAGLSCYFTYAQGSGDIAPGLGNNAAELAKLDRFVRQALSHPTLFISRVRLTGYSSVEGSYARNESLAQERVDGFIVNCHLSIVNCISSCTRAEVVYYREGTVNVLPDRSAHTLPVLTYYFYDQQDDRLCLSATGDAEGDYHGRLTEGDYRLIAVNARAAGVTYKDMNEVKTARVIDNDIVSVPEVTRSGSPAVRALSAEAAVWRVAMGSFRVDMDETVTLVPVPDLLSHTLQLDFIAEEDMQDRVTALSGALSGVYPSVDLYTGKTAASEIARSPGLQADYAAVRDGSNPGLWTAALELFGLYDPNTDADYRNVMTFSVTVDGTPRPVTVDITPQLANALSYYAGDLPVNIPLKLEINLTKAIDEHGAIFISAEVMPWMPMDGKTVEI